MTTIDFKHFAAWLRANCSDYAWDLEYVDAMLRDYADHARGNAPDAPPPDQDPARALLMFVRENIPHDFHPSGKSLAVNIFCRELWDLVRRFAISHDHEWFPFRWGQICRLCGAHVYNHAHAWEPKHIGRRCAICGLWEYGKNVAMENR
jgi:hypothetical protein